MFINYALQRYHYQGVLARHGDPSGDPEVMNGIAFDDNTQELYFSGKRWKTMFKTKLS